MIARRSSLLLASIVLASCAPTTAYVTARHIEAGAAQVLMDSYEAWRKIDVAHQQQILASSETLAGYEIAISNWRTRDQQPIDKAFTAARDTVYAYSKSLDTDDAVKQKDFGVAIGNVLGAISALAAILVQYGVNVPKVVP